MVDVFVGAGTALWLGILTSVSPCPLATNIAALSYMARRIENPRRVFLNGCLYTFGRSAAYIVLGGVLAASLVSAPLLSHGLQRYSGKIVGPLLVLVGMVVAGLITLPWKAAGPGNAAAGRVRPDRPWGAFVLGVLFALSFCPLSAALFFGSLIPIAVETRSYVVVPALFGAGTAVPVVAVALLLALGVKSLSALFRRLTEFEVWARRGTGVFFIALGIVLTLTNVFGIGS